MGICTVLKCNSTPKRDLPYMTKMGKDGEISAQDSRKDNRVIITTIIGLEQLIIAHTME